jgi:four helix bundle protein
MARRTDLKARMTQFALAVVRLAAQLRPGSAGWLLRGQLVRAGTGVGANYRASCRAKSRADFIAKLGTTEEEADEAAYWLELLIECGDMPAGDATPVLEEARELTAIIVASIRTAKRNDHGGRRA